MAYDSRYDILFEPVKIGPKTAPNRFWQTPQCNGAGTDFPGFQAGFRAMKAEGGYGTVFTELTSIAPEAACDPYQLPEVWEDDDVRNLRLMTEQVHEHGALAGIELGYSPMFGVAGKARAPLLGVTAMSSDWVRFPHIGNHHEMDKDDIAHMRRLHVEAAKRSRDAGFDLITIHMGHASTVLVRFLIPFYNRRTDEYGGSLENRARLALETMEEVRAAIGDDCGVGFRLGVDTLPLPFGIGPEGTTADEGHAFIELADHLVDYWDITVGGGAWGEDAGPSRTHPENHEKPYVSGVKAHTDKPVVNVGRFTNPDTMLSVIRDGQCDLVGMARPSIADPFIPTKIREGRTEDIRECIGCNICVSRWELGGPRIICTQNATSGEEYRRGWHPEKFTPAANRENDVLIVGAGPAGMECAVVLGKRGMRRVHLVDAGAELGGSMRWISALPGRGEWARVTNYRKVQLDKLRNVEVILKTKLDADAVLGYGAEIVVIATGSHWDAAGTSSWTQGPLPIAEEAAAKVFTPEDIMVHSKKPGERVVVYDSDGYYVGAGLAEKLAREGHQVLLITPSSEVSAYSEFTLEHPRLIHDLHGLGVELLTHTMLTEVRGESVVTANIHTDHEGEQPCDGVVFVNQRWADDELYRQLKARPDELASEGITGLYEIGDCAVPGLIADAVFSGHRLAREIDSPDPSRPLPFIRERRLVDSTEADFAKPNGATTGAVAVGASS